MTRENQPPDSPERTLNPIEGITVVKGGNLLDWGYKIRNCLGSGNFGVVHLAEARGGVEVAIKEILQPVGHQQFQRELQALELVKRLRCPFLLQIHAFWTWEERLYIIMELANGNLRDRLRKYERKGLSGIPVAELLVHMFKVAMALDYMHENHVQHGDIKPENVLLVEGHSKVGDFGLARPQASQRLMSADGSGTPLYMAPEVWQGKVSPHSDQYSLAAMYKELRCGTRLFSDCTLPQLMVHHLEDTPDLAPLPEAERRVLHRALAKNPGQRFPNCLEFVGQLQKASQNKAERTSNHGLNRSDFAHERASAALPSQCTEVGIFVASIMGTILNLLFWG